MNNQSELVSQFITMTQADEAQAQFFLEMSNWDLQVAISQYFESNSNNNNQQQAEPPVSSTVQNKRPTSGSSSRIRTFRDLSNEAEDEDNSDDDEHENLYAGGEKSGEHAHDERAKTKKKPNTYTGTGYRLGSEDEPSTVASSAPVEQQDEPEQVTRHLTFWRNGFSVDDGPLYEYADPANQQMLAAINSGRAPLSLLNVRHGQPVEVRVIKRQDEDYTPPPKAPPKPFEGVGHRLGSPATYVEPPTAAPGTFPSTGGATAPTVDESQPMTSIQIRLGDGSRMVAKLNHTHTIGDIRQYIEA
ncbi:SEP-domain-containing protein [Rhizopus microsporus var. microsporus]|uniref:SEP-domain-containing protein n=1 Tax=Rhizopus microsporus var. microsporus TaxID=86635 RepID=A0A1X0RGJ5_RHIZD|nr:SEP-domain-containing protein [Rhizopus microsporus var. microsporus]